MTDPTTLVDPALSALEVALANTEPMTEDEIARSMRLISRRAWESSQEHRTVCTALGKAPAAEQKAYWDALLASQTEHPDRKVGHHEAIARHASLELAATVKGMTLMERSLRKEGETLEKLISALQSQLKSLRVDA
jgi:hypothetical protein